MYNINSILQTCKWFIGGGNIVRVQGWELVASASAGAVCRPARCIIPTYIASRCAVSVRCSGGAVTPSPRTTCGPVATCGDGGGGGGGYRTTMLILPPLTGPTRLSGAVTADMMTVIMRRAAVGPRRVRVIILLVTCTINI